MYFYNLWLLLKLFSNIAFECAFGCVSAEEVSVVDLELDLLFQAFIAQ